MREAFPEWRGQRAYVMEMAADDPKAGRITVATSPALVVALDDTHRVLVVTGFPSDEKGALSAAHVTPGNLGACWFVRRDARWWVTDRHDSILWAGSSGAVGTVKQAALGPAHQALFVESGWCGQGYCVGVLDVLELGIDAAHIVSSAVPLSSDSLGVAEGCDKLLGGVADLAPAVVRELTPDNCFDVAGQWRVEPRPDSDRGDIVIDFSGHELVQDAATQAKSVQTITEQLVLRHSATGYVRIRGRNPMHKV